MSSNVSMQCAQRQRATVDEMRSEHGDHGGIMHVSRDKIAANGPTYLSAATTSFTLSASSGLGSGSGSSEQLGSYRPSASSSQLLYTDTDPLADMSLSSLRFDDMDAHDLLRHPRGKLIIGRYSLRYRDIGSAAALLLLLLLCVVLLACLLGRSNHPHVPVTPSSLQVAGPWSDQLGGVCGQPPCLQESALLLAVMNGSAPPCTAASSFACAHFGSVHPLMGGEAHTDAAELAVRQLDATLLQLLESEGEVGRPGGARAKVRLLYRSCVAGERRRGRPVLELLRGAGGWGAPAPEAWSESTWSVSEAVRQVSAVLGVDVFFGWRVLGANTLEVTYPSVHDRAYLLYGTSYEGVVAEARRAFLNTTATLLAQDWDEWTRSPASTWDGRSQEGARRRQSIASFVGDVMYMEHRMHAARFAQNNEIGKEQVVTVGFLQRAFPWLDWTRFVRTALLSSRSGRGWVEPDRWPSATTEQPEVTWETRVRLDCLDYLQSVSLVLQSTTRRCLNNLVAWSLIRELLPHLSADYQLALDQFRSAVHVSSPTAPRQRCLHFLRTSAMRRALLALTTTTTAGADGYGHEQEMTGGADVRVATVVANVRLAFREERLWRDQAASQYIQNKLNSIRVVRELDVLSSEAQLDQYYDQLDVSDVYFDNVLRVRQFGRFRSSSSSSLTLSNTNTTSSVTVASGKSPSSLVANDPETSWPVLLVLPHHLTSAPFLHWAYPRFLLYARLAPLLAHQLLIMLGSSRVHAESGLSGEDGLPNMAPSDGREIISRLNKCALTSRSKQRHPADSSVTSQPDLLLHKLAVHLAFKAYELAETAATAPDDRLPGLHHLTLRQSFYLAAAQLHCEVSDAVYETTSINMGISTGNHIIDGGVATLPGFVAAFRCPRSTTEATSQQTSGDDDRSNPNQENCDY